MEIMKTYQQKVREWAVACFGETIVMDKEERNQRFMEESLELVQSLGMDRDHVLQLVDYVFNREIGEPMQEVGGVMTTLASLCNAHEMDLQECANGELVNCWLRIDKIREKQKNKPKHSPLPQEVRYDSTKDKLSTDYKTDNVHDMYG